MTKKVLLTTLEYPPTVGGLGVATQRLARNLAASGYRVHIVAAEEGVERDVRTTEEDGLVVHRVRQPFAADPSAGFVLRQLLQRLDAEVQFDLFHGMFLPAVYPLLSVAGARPLVASIRGTDAVELLDQPSLRALILPALRKATWITSVNQLYLNRVAEEVTIAGRSSVIRNGVVPVAGEQWRLDDTNRGVVGTAGRFRRVKDIPLLIRGYERVPPQLRRRLILAGGFADPTEESWSQTLIGEFGIGDEVTITGSLPHAEVLRRHGTFHVYVQSSAYEGMPNALLEAASLGVPLVATAVGGMAETITDGESGLLVPHGDPAALGGAITRVLGDDALAQHLSAGALRLVAELSPERERDAWLALYARLLSA